MRDDLGAIQIQILPILKAAGIRRAAIFGSLARGEATDESDVDLLIDSPDGTTLLDVIALEHELEDALGREVDLVEYQAIKPRLRDRILREQVPIL